MQPLKIYVINLEQRRDRWESIFASFKRLEKQQLDYKIIRINAVNGKEIDLEQDSGKFSLYLKYKMKALNDPEIPDDNNSHFFIKSRGAIGCTLSHVKALESFLATNDEYAIICEDDINVAATLDLKTQVDLFKNSGADLLHLHTGLALPDAYLCGSEAYLLNRKGAQVIMDHIFPLELHFDAYLHTLEKLNKLDARRVSKNIIWQKAEWNSDIHTGKFLWKMWLSNSCITLILTVSIILILTMISTNNKKYLNVAACIGILTLGIGLFPTSLIQSFVYRLLY